MQRQASGSGFPTMSSFGGQPSKRMKVEEPQKQVPVNDFMDDDDDWGDLDEEAMEECMVLATQMCSQAPQNESNVSKNIGNSKPINNNVENVPGSSHNNISDSGFSSTRSNSFNNSRIIQNNVKMGRGHSGQTNSASHSNSYSHRFNDFSIPNTKSGPSVMKPIHSTGKVYNSVPLKSSGTAYPKVQATTSGAVGDGNVQNLLKKVQEEKSRLEEEVLMKQGEISLLRSELKRKESALEAERLDRCAALEAAEKKGREKVANAAAEAEAKTKESKRSVERLQGELHFKNREIEELTTRCRRLEQQGPGPSQVSSPPKRGRHEPASQISPGKARSNFKSHFDFGGGPASVRSIEVQTESSQPQVKRNRGRLSIDTSKGKVTGCRRASYMLSSHSMADVTKDKEGNSANWCLEPKWSSLVSQLVTEQKESSNVEKHLVILAIERLREMHTLLTVNDRETRRIPSGQTSPKEWYEGSVVPALSVLGSLMAPFVSEHAPSALQVTSSHLTPLYVKEVVVNDRIRQQILEAIENIAKFTTDTIEGVICKEMVASLSDCCTKIDDWHEVVTVLKCLRALATQTTFISLLCNKTASCLIDKICTLISENSGDRLTSLNHLLSWLAVLVTTPPPWLRSSCYCNSKLLSCLLKQTHFILDFTKPHKAYERQKVHKLLKILIRVLHCWSTADPDWWVKVASLPEYTAIMGTIVANADDLKIDRQTVDLLCDLYDFDETAFDGC